MNEDAQLTTRPAAPEKPEHVTEWVEQVTVGQAKQGHPEVIMLLRPTPKKRD